MTAGLREQQTYEHAGIPLVRTDRGGLTTIHNPGQLIIYPLIPLKKWGLNVRSYVDLLIRATELFILKCNIIIVPNLNGVYSQNGKIASIGINIKKGISTHGVAINISNDLAPFDLIRPCGIAGQAMDKVANYHQIELLEAFQQWCAEFDRCLNKESSGTETAALTSIALSH